MTTSNDHPPAPNFDRNSNPGRLVTDRFDFQTHVNGTAFRHDATMIDLNPDLTFGLIFCTTVQEALEALGGLINPSAPKQATIGTTIANLGVVTLGGDFGGTGLIPVVTGLQGRAISTLPPSNGNVLTWSSSTGWTPQSFTGVFTAGGDLSGTSSVQTVIGLQGHSVLSQTLGSGQNGYVLTWNNSSSVWQASPSTGGGSGITQLTGDVLAGPSFGSVVAEVVAINGATVPIANNLLTQGNVLQVTGTSSLGYGPVNLAGGPNYVTGTLPAANQAAQTLAGDVTGPSSANTVVKIQGNAVKVQTLGAGQDQYILTWNNATTNWQALPNAGGGAGGITQLTGDVLAGPGSGSLPATVVNIHGASVPVAGALTQGNVLQVLVGNAGAGLSTLTYAPVNLAGGANYVTGVLPAANQAAQTLAGDVTGAASSNVVMRIHGTSVPASPTNGQVLTATSSTTATWQAPASGGITQLINDVHAGPGSGVVSAVVWAINGATVPVSGALTNGNVLQVTAPSVLSYMPINVGGGTGYITGVLPSANQAAQTLTGDVTGTTSANTVMKIHGTSVPASPTNGQVLTATSSTTATWQSPSGAGITFANDLVNSTSTNQYVSGLSYSSASAGGTINVNGTNTLLNWVTNGVTLQQASTTLVQLKQTSTDFMKFGGSSSTVGFIRAPTNSVIIGVSGNNTILQTDSSPATYLNSPTQVLLTIGNVTQVSVTTTAVELIPSNLLFATTGGGDANITFASNASGAGTALSIAAQSAGSGNTNGGGLILQTGSGVGSGVSGTMQFFNGSTQSMDLTPSTLSLLPNIINFTATSGTGTFIEFASQSTTSGSSITIQSQAGASGHFGGQLNLNAGTGGGGGLPGSINFNAGSTNLATFGTSANGGAEFFSSMGTATWSGITHRGDPSSSATASFNFAAYDGSPINIPNTGSTTVLSAVATAYPIIPFSGDISTSCFIVVPNNIGATWFFDFSQFTISGGSLTIGTGSGYQSVLTTGYGGGTALITVCVTASNRVVVG